MGKSKTYNHASHIHWVMNASKSRLGGRLVLQCLCFRADFDQPQVIITKNQISRVTGLERKAVQRALKLLRAEGCIKPLRGFAGGKGVAVTYELIVIGDSSTRPAETGDDQVRKRRFTELLKHHEWSEALRLCDAEFGPSK